MSGQFRYTPRTSIIIRDIDGNFTCPSCNNKTSRPYPVIKNDSRHYSSQCLKCFRSQKNAIIENGFAIDFYTKITKAEYEKIRGYEYDENVCI